MFVKGCKVFQPYGSAMESIGGNRSISRTIDFITSAQSKTISQEKRNTCILFLFLDIDGLMVKGKKTLI